MAAEPVQRRIQFVFDQYQIFPNDNLTLCYFGMANEVYIVPTKNGRYVLKNCFKSNTKALISNEVALIEQLNANGCPTPQIVPDKDGNPYVDFDGEIYLMTEYCPDTTYNWSSDIPDKAHRETIRAMADFHRATESFIAPYSESRPCFLDMKAHYQRLDKFQGAGEDAGRESVRRMAEYLPKLRALADTLDREIAAADLSAAKKSFVHGDLHCFNLFYDEEGNYSGVTDFDFSRPEYRLADVFWTSRILGFREVRRRYTHEEMEAMDYVLPDDKALEVLVHVWSMIIPEYRRHAELSDEELALVPLFIRAVPLYISQFFQFSNSEQECIEHLNWFEWEMSQVERNLTQTMQAIEKVLSDEK